MNKYKQPPLLSLCMPTYNRARLLEQMLRSLVPQVNAAAPDVELIVSDNCSTDNTREVVERASEWGPIRYHRNAQNEGFARNMLVVTNELAKGEFCWTIGDDDMMIRGKVAKLVNIIRANSDLDCFIVNFFYKHIQERNRLILEKDSFYIPEKGECVCWDFSERRLSKWEELLDFDGIHPPYMFHYIGCNVFRRSMWCANVHLVRIEKGKELVDFDTTFPHLKILAHAMVGRPAYYIGDPMVLLGVASQEWDVGWPAKRYKVTLDSFRLYESLGVASATIRRLQLWLLDHEFHSIASIVARVGTPGREYFSLRKFLWANRKCPKTKIARLMAWVVFMWIFVRMTDPIQTALKNALTHNLVIRISRRIVPLRIRRVLGNMFWRLWVPPAEKKDGGV